MTAVIEIEGLRKEYRRPRRPPHQALAGLDLTVPEGGVFGFLGPNGSGKTTTIRCLLGLVRPTSGRAHVLGAETPARLPEVVGNIGSIVETPTLFPTFSGRRNLELLGALEGIGKRSVTAALERVGLAERADDLVRTYSLGMKQRLGLAAALLKDPALVVLDEPANGLDPAGIRSVRLLLRSLGEEGRTVFVSSHLLNEVQQTCDRVAILNRGRTVTTGSVAEVLARRVSSQLVVRVADLEAGAAALRHAGFTTAHDDGSLRVTAAPDAGPRITQVLAESGQWVAELRPEEATLEDLFLELTGAVDGLEGGVR